ncbi:MAG: TonB-dependent receptor [Flavobacteriaceae bacterium]|nr:MAG: TonB-dependent receptor [Flavobacteriaceae bacterium]
MKTFNKQSGSKLFRLLIISMLFASTNIFAHTIRGTVKDSANAPLEGVNIVNLSNNRHTHTDKNGAFVMEGVAVGDTLQFTYLGYQTVEIAMSKVEESMGIVMNPKAISLNEVVIARKINALHVVTDIDVQTSPVNSSQEVLRKVPGLFIGQHAGGGKAEQIFLRGFDIDHGTDVALSVDGLPVNMVSHAHGQGYSDLHFIIPEVIEEIDFGKGPYYAEQGNFNTAGYVNFKTKDQLKKNQIKWETGQFNTNRLMTGFNITDTHHHTAYIASEYIATDGPFESPQNFSRINLFAKYAGDITHDDRLEFIVSHFTSTWDASGQIPRRAVDNGSITRFGAIDDTEGGTTSRTNILINYEKRINEHSSIKSDAYFSNYSFELYSNFTFFLNNPVSGDQIRQKENRDIYGFSSEYNYDFSHDDDSGFDGQLQLGVRLRNDQSGDNELSRTANRRQTLSQVQLGDINETNIGSYANMTFNVGKWTFNPAIRLDHFNFQYNDALSQTFQRQSEKESIISPKLNILYNPTETMQWYLKTGKGFHSNDARVVVNRNGNDILPAAYGADFGFLWKPSPKVILNLAYWYLFLEQEFVYVGDEGIVEPGGKTVRQGLDFSLRYQPKDWLYWNLDVNYAHARTTEALNGENFIPLAPDLTLVSSLRVVHSSGFFSELNTRYIDDRPANEDNSIVAEGYTVFDLNTGYEWKNIRFGIQIQNLFDVDWNETQFATESRLQNEATSAEEIHFTPGTPFFIRGILSYQF